VDQEFVTGGLSNGQPSVILGALWGVCHLMAKVDVFIDGDNISIECQKLYGARPDYKTLARLVASRFHHTLGTVRYYDSPTRNPIVQPRQQRFWEELRQKHIEVKLGRTEPNYDGTHRQKECDVMVACDMLYGAFTTEYDLAVLVSGDTDYAYALEMVTRQGREVGWVYLPSQEHVDRIKQVVQVERRLLLDEKTFRTVMLRPPAR
jgi:uncharacterized LabA/DUF88 family protein